MRRSERPSCSIVGSSGGSLGPWAWGCLSVPWNLWGTGAAKSFLCGWGQCACSTESQRTARGLYRSQGLSQRTVDASQGGSQIRLLFLRMLQVPPCLHHIPRVLMQFWKESSGKGEGNPELLRNHGLNWLRFHFFHPAELSDDERWWSEIKKKITVVKKRNKVTCIVHLRPQ